MKNTELINAARRVAVVSIGRSGTSLFARILHEVLGVDFGLEADHIPRNHNNPDGYFENAEFLAFNDRILQATNASVLSPPPMNYVSQLAPDLRAALVNEARILLAKYALDKPIFGWKDPRLSFTLPIWHAASPSMAAIIAFREPLSALSSIAAQLERPINTILPLWFQYYRRVFAYTSDMPRCVVSFDNLLTNPLPVVVEMAQRLDIALDESMAHAKLLQIIKPQQSRHTSAQNTANSPLILDAQTNGLYLYLRKIAKDKAQPERATLERLLG